MANTTEVETPSTVETKQETTPMASTNGSAPKVESRAETPKVKKEGRVRRIVMPLLLIIVLGFAGNYAYHRIIFSQNHEDTDDAQVDGNIDPVLPRISGYVTGVLVNDNQLVDRGQVLVTLDTADLYLKVRVAETGLMNAEAAVAVAKANIASYLVNKRKTAQDLERDTKLLAGGAITQQQLDATKAAAEAAAAQFAAVTEQINVAQAQVSQKQVDLDQAKLQLSYATIAAPAKGLVSKKSVQIGQFIQAGQPLMGITENDSVWVTANFKETQVSDIRAGQPVDIEVDAYKGKIFHGRVQSFSPATGAKFALLPPDNSTGNFVKVVQRVPVKILIEDKADPATPLRPGMSVSAIVTTK